MHQIKHKRYIVLVQHSVPFLSRRQEVVQHLRTLHSKDTVCSDKVSMLWRPRACELGQIWEYAHPPLIHV